MRTAASVVTAAEAATEAAATAAGWAAAGGGGGGEGPAALGCPHEWLVHQAAVLRHGDDAPPTAMISDAEHRWAAWCAHSRAAS